MLEGYVKVGQDLALGHQRNHVVDGRIGIDVVQADPDAELCQGVAQFLESRLDRLAAPETGPVFEIDTVGAGVLRNHEDFLDPGARQVFGFGQHIADRTRDQWAAQRGDDAEGATVVAAFGNFQVGEVVRRQAHALWRHQIGIRVMRFGQVLMNVTHHLVSGMRAGDGKHRGVGGLDDVALGAKATGDDDLAVLGQGLADGVERLFHRGIDEAAGVDDDEVRIVVAWRDFVALGTQLGQDALGVATGFRATQGNKADGRHFRSQILHLGYDKQQRTKQKSPDRASGLLELWPAQSI